MVHVVGANYLERSIADLGPCLDILSVRSDGGYLSERVSDGCIESRLRGVSQLEHAPCAHADSDEGKGRDDRDLLPFGGVFKHLFIIRYLSTGYI